MLSEAEIETVRDKADLRATAQQLGAQFRGKARYGRCPICGGGPSAARFEILRDGRTWVCAVCADGGDVIKLYMRVKGVGFRKAVEDLGGPVALSDDERRRLDDKIAADRARREKDADAYRQRERRTLFSIWNNAARLPGTPVEAYLRGRGIGWRREDLSLRFAVLPFFHGEIEDERGRTVPREIYRGPTMLAAIVDAAGKFSGLHQTWIDPAKPGEKAVILDPDNGQKLSSKKMRGHKQGGFVRLMRAGDATRLCVGEGIETTLSVREALREGFAYRAAGDLGNLAGKAVTKLPHPFLKTPSGRAQPTDGPDPDFDSEAMPVPRETRELVLVKDGDSDAFLTDHAMARAARRHARPGLTIREMSPPPGFDFNDVLRETV